MRIDFSQLDDDNSGPTTHQLQIDNNIFAFWGQQEEKKAISQARQDTPEVNFEVSYPFEVRRSLSPQNLQKQFSYLKAKQVLPTSTLNFIKSSINKEHGQSQIKQDQDQSFQACITESKPNESPDRNTHSFYFDRLSSTYGNQGNIEGNIENRSPLQQSPLIKKKKVIEGIGFRSEQRAKGKAQKIKQAALEVLAARKEKEVEDLTLHPVLNYTMNSKTAKRVEEKRKKHFNSTQSSVFQSLYNDAARYSAKRQIEKMKMEQYGHQKDRKKSRMQVFTTFQQRLQRSLEASAERKRIAQNKQEVDPATHRKMFVPDTHLSKLTYYSHFKSSFSISKFPQEQQTPARPEHYSRESSKLGRSRQDITTTLNHSLGEISQLYRKCEGKPQLVPTLPGRREERLAEIYSRLLCKNGKLEISNLSSCEKKVMAGFLSQLNQFEYSATVSRQVFMTLFKDFIGRLNLFDKQILIRRLKKQVPSQQSSRTEANSSFSFLKPKGSKVQAPDHHHKFFYV